MNRWLALVESNTSGTGRDFVSTARSLGLHPILITSDATRYPYVVEDGVDVYRADTNDPVALTKACCDLSSRGELAGISTSSELYIENAARSAHALGLPGANPVAVHICRNKWRQRRVLSNAMVRVPAYRLATTVQEALHAARVIGGRVVVKPITGSGSSGVRLCKNADEAAAHANVLLTRGVNERGQSIPQCVLVEELVIGPEFSVEMFSGKVVGITEKHLGALPNFVEIGHDYPAELSDSDANALSDAACKSVHALGLGFGATHVELRQSTKGPVIIEVNPRLAGGCIPKLVHLATGVDMVAATLRIAVGLTPQLYSTRQEYASIRFLLPDSDGAVSSAHGWEAVKALPGVAEASLYLPVGGTVAHHGDFRDRIGHVIGIGATSAMARSTAEQARSGIHLTVSPQPRQEGS